MFPEVLISHLLRRLLTVARRTHSPARGTRFGQVPAEWLTQNLGTAMGRVMKRTFDLCVSAVALVILSPALITIWLLLRARVGSPAFYRQQRPGLHGEPFNIIKFRTMTDSRGADGRLLPDAERITPIGQFMRRTSLDELPSLWPVFRGHMSLVGPRPLLMEYLPIYDEFQTRRHEVKPGVTGWAQVNGRNALSWEEKFALDVWYVDNRSFGLDLVILIKTVRKVLLREGISAAGEATMSTFEGTRKRRALRFEEET